jgi:hypothetical protein
VFERSGRPHRTSVLFDYEFGYDAELDSADHKCELQRDRLYNLSERYADRHKQHNHIWRHRFDCLNYLQLYGGGARQCRPVFANFASECHNGGGWHTGRCLYHHRYGHEWLSGCHWLTSAYTYSQLAHPSNGRRPTREALRTWSRLAEHAVGRGQRGDVVTCFATFRRRSFVLT